MTRKILIDTDPGIDDAVALLLALACPELEVLGVVAVMGNLPVAMTERNTRLVCQLAGRPEIAVHAGCSRPLLRPLREAADIHGEDLAERLGLSEPSMPLRPEHGVDFIVETLRAAETSDVTLCALGPLTDLALALAKAPDIARRVGELVLMGGAGFEIGNVTPAAEFNIHVDPHAAAIVLESGIPVTMIPLDVTHRVLTTPPRLAALRALPNRCGPVAARLLAGFEEARADRFGARGQALHDPCVIAYLMRPDLFRGREVNVAVETESPLTLGETVVDWFGVSGRPASAKFLTEVDAEGVYDLLIAGLARLP